MAHNKFFTIMVVPEKTQNVRRVVVPHYVFKGGVLISAFLFVLATIMILDYANVMQQISENKKLKNENRLLRQEVQVFKDKMLTIDSTIDRVKTFTTKLRIITNIEDRSGTVPSSMPPAPMIPGPATPTELDGVDSSQATPSSPALDLKLEPKFEATSNPTADKPKVLTKKERQNLRTMLLNSTESLALATDGETSLFVQSEFEKLNTVYEQLNILAQSQEKETQEIYEQLNDKRSMLQSMPTITPTEGYITSGFGIRFSPYGGKRKMHEGIDIANRYGAEVVAPGDGVVLFAGVKPGYGKIVSIDHGYGLKSYFGHSSAFYVTAGQRVKRGQRIATVGSTGRSTGPHCHYEIHAGDTPIDPMYYLLDR